MIHVAAQVLASVEALCLIAAPAARAIATYQVISAISLTRPRLMKYCLSTALMLRATAPPSTPTMLCLWGWNMLSTPAEKKVSISLPLFYFLVQVRNMWLAVCFNRKKIFKIKIDKILFNINNVAKKFNGLAILFIKKNVSSSKIKRRIDFIILGKKII